MRASKTRTARRQSFKSAMKALHTLETSADVFSRWEHASGYTHDARIEQVRKARLQLVVAALELAAHVDGEDTSAVVAALKAVSS